MANRLRNEVEIELAGKTRKLRATFDTIVVIESTIGTSIIGLLRSGGISFKDAATIILCGMHGADDKSLTLEQIGEAVFEAGMSAVGPKVIDFLHIAMDGVSLGKPEGEAARS